ncbi:hypothetical protein NIES4101_65900 [Calothrix sp. NIES-4101]|nr:hypothetical protein NIES4101_65900 [Calothrix sp. NIES-4101]
MVDFNQVFPKRIRNFINRLLPSKLLKFKTQYQVKQTHRRFNSRGLKETFTSTYEENLWGGNKGEYYSGTGSDDRIAEKYSQQIDQFIQEHNIKKVLDLGCGDFRVASQFITSDVDYTGVDIVDSVIKLNNEKYGDERVQFHCLDITKDSLPSSELCLVRQVLQHLSNAEILSVLENLEKQNYSFILITEHIPTGQVELPNQDIPHGPYTRLFHGSGVFLDKPPFSKKVKTLFEIPDKEMTGILRTVVLEK